MENRIAIVGGAGFVSLWLAKSLIKDYEITLLDIRRPSIDLDGSAKFVYCDVTNYESLVQGLQDADMVIHTAIVQIPQINEQKRIGYEVNVVGTQNVCKAVEENPKIKGLILSGSWHTIGERDLKGVVDEEFGFRPDKVENRARLYALSKMAQEAIVRFFDEICEKTYGIIRMGTVLGEGMPEQTAANMFIEKGLKGEPITPFMHSMYRPMLYVGIADVCNAYRRLVSKILNNKSGNTENSLYHIINVYYPKPITILDLAEMVRKSIVEESSNRINPKIEIIDDHLPMLFKEKDIAKLEVSIEKAKNYLGIKTLASPQELIRQLVVSRLAKMKLHNT